VVKTITLLISAAALLVAGTLFVRTSPASAHERRAVPAGDEEYGFVVGFLGEPAYLNQPNGLSVRVYTVEPGVELLEATSEQRVGVEGLEETLQAEVSQGAAEPMALTLEGAFGEPGAYDGNFLPTALGDYTFHITGTINGEEIDETFTSSPETFSSIDEPAEYPVQIQTNQELEAALGSDGSSSDDDSDSNAPMIIAIIGVVLGAAGVVAGGVALSRGRA